MTDFWKNGKVSVNGVIVEPEDARISVFDRGFLFGESIFETLRVYRGAPFAFEEHLTRFFRSGEKISLGLSWGAERIRADCQAVLKEAGLEEAYMRIIATQGSGPIGLAPSEVEEPQLIVIVLPLPSLPRDLYEQGRSAVTVSVLRNLKLAIDPGAKTGNYMNSVQAAREARRRGADEAIMLNFEGNVAEGSSANVFGLIDGVWCTPSLEVGILSGITRKVLLRLCERNDIPVQEGLLRPEDLARAEEIFLCSSVRELVPIVSLDEGLVGSGRVGEHYGALSSLYQEERERYCQTQAEAWG